jgi:hypothetical protein
VDIDLSQELVYKVKLPDGKTVELREPTDDDVLLISNLDANGDPSGSNEAFKKFVIALGMPADELKKIGVVRLKKLAQGLMEPLQEGK